MRLPPTLERGDLADRLVLERAAVVVEEKRVDRHVRPGLEAALRSRWRPSDWQARRRRLPPRPLPAVDIAPSVAVQNAAISAPLKSKVRFTRLISVSLLV